MQLVKKFIWKFCSLNVKWEKKEIFFLNHLNFKKKLYWESFNAFYFSISYLMVGYFYFYIIMTYESIFFLKLIHSFQYDFD